MRKNLSIFMLAVRFTIYKVIGLLAVMSGVQAGLFLWAMKRRPEGNLISLLTESRLEWAALIGFVFLCIFLCACGDGSGRTRSVYTIRSLSVSELATTGWWAFHHSLMYLVFWLWEAFSLLGLCLIYSNWMPEATVGPQTVFIACYQVDFMHRLIPLADISGWIRNGVMVWGLGICSSASAYHGRRENRARAIWFMAIIAVVGFAGWMGRSPIADVQLTLWGIIVAGWAAMVVIKREHCWKTRKL